MSYSDAKVTDTFNAFREALHEAQARPYGPAYNPDDAQKAGEACVKLCEGNSSQARTLWKLIVEDLGADYMPHAAVVALLRAARTEGLDVDIEAPEVT